MTSEAGDKIEAIRIWKRMALPHKIAHEIDKS
jgi:hypothetical protein